MADVTKTVLTRLEADVKNYVDGMKAAEVATEKVSESSDAVVDKTRKIGTQAKDTSKEFDSSIGKMAGALGSVIPGFDKIAGGFQQAEKAAKAFGITTKSALISTGIGVLIIAVQELYDWWVKLKNEQDEQAKERSERMQQQVKDEQDTAEIIKKNNATVAMLDLQLAADRARVAGESLEKIHALEVQAFEEKRKLMRQAGATAAEIVDEELRMNLRHQEEIKDRNEALAETAKKKAEVTEKERQHNRVLEYQNELLAINAQRELEAQLAADDAATEKDIKDEESFFDWAKRQNSILRLNQEVADAHEAEFNAEQERKKAIIASKQAQQKALSQLASESKAAAIGLVTMDTANAVMAVMKDPSIPFTWLKFGIAALVAGMGVQQAAKIANAKTYADGGMIPAKTGGMIRGRRHYQGGVKFRIGGYAAEAEGGEFIVNRRSTKRFLPVLRQINNTYADGGMVAAQAELTRLQGVMADAASQSRTVLVVEDYRRASNRLDIVESLAKV